MFHDEIDITLSSGKGGDGAATFRREKFVPRGGPNGGDGGDGGDVIIRANVQLHDVNHLAGIRSLSAQNGGDGGKNKLHGKNGDDLIIEVPAGTKVSARSQSHDEWRPIYDLTHDGAEARILVGGHGGRGNVHFATATHQTPREFEPGKPAQTKLFRLVVELIADVGIIGLPNAGKSTLLSTISGAKPKVADYPFTTVSPVLGIVQSGDSRLVFADIPGLIEGAASGRGLGHQFLRHIERTKVLLHLIDASSENYARDYQIIRNELARYSPQLSRKAELVALSKSDLIQKDNTQKIAALHKALVQTGQLFARTDFSAASHKNIDNLLRDLFTLCQ